MSSRVYILTLSTRETTKTVARIATFIADCGGSVIEAGYYSDPDTGWFFTRQAVLASSIPVSLDAFRRQLAVVAAGLGPDTSWTLHDTNEIPRIVLLASSEPHCMHDLLGRAATGELPGTIEAVIGNHADLADIVLAHGVKFHHVPFPSEPDERAAAFEQVAKLADNYDPHAIVLTRFMQIVPPALCERWAGRAINIHHSFLPSFAGARPYHQAYARGVKLVGATCHYVTADLDAGPIIEQDVTRIDHADTIADLKRLGRDTERVVLARGLRWHLEGRVLVRDGKTVVFN